MAPPLPKVMRYNNITRLPSKFSHNGEDRDFLITPGSRDYVCKVGETEGCFFIDGFAGKEACTKDPQGKQ
jgi:hypothetical protein